MDVDDVSGKARLMSRIPENDDQMDCDVQPETVDVQMSDVPRGQNTDTTTQLWSVFARKACEVRKHSSAVNTKPAAKRKRVPRRSTGKQITDTKCGDALLAWLKKPKPKITQVSEASPNTADCEASTDGLSSSDTDTRIIHTKPAVRVVAAPPLIQEAELIQEGGDVCERVGRRCVRHDCGMQRQISRVAAEGRERALVSWQCSGYKADLQTLSLSAGAGRFGDTENDSNF